jgi:hypothetical protein
MRWRSALLTASSGLLLAGCGGHEQAAPPPPPKIPAGIASQLAVQADRIAALAPGSCASRDEAARFRTQVIASVGRVPARYREPLMSATNDLAERLAACVAPRPQKQREHGKHEKHGKHDKKEHDD